MYFPFKGLKHTFKGLKRTFKGLKHTFKGLKRKILNLGGNFFSVDRAKRVGHTAESSPLHVISTPGFVLKLATWHFGTENGTLWPHFGCFASD